MGCSCAVGEEERWKFEVVRRLLATEQGYDQEQVRVEDRWSARLVEGHKCVFEDRIEVGI